MKTLLSLIVFGALAASAGAAEPEQPRQHGEVFKLIHHTKQHAEFREDIVHQIDSLRQRKPEMPSWFWDELEREVSVDGYAQWLVGLFEKGLSEDEVLQLNVVFGDPAKKALLDKLFEKLHGKKGDDFVREVREFQRTTDAGLADEIVRFAQSPAAAKYGAVLGEIKSGRKEVVIRLFMEADHRIRARQK